MLCLTIRESPPCDRRSRKRKVRVCDDVWCALKRARPARLWLLQLSTRMFVIGEHIKRTFEGLTCCWLSHKAVHSASKEFQPACCDLTPWFMLFSLNSLLSSDHLLRVVPHKSDTWGQIICRAICSPHVHAQTGLRLCRPYFLTVFRRAWLQPVQKQKDINLAEQMC